MKRIRGTFVWLIISIVITAVTFSVYLVMQATSQSFVDSANAPHNETDVNGLLGAFGVFTQLTSMIPLGFAIIFAALSLYLGFRLRRKLKMTTSQSDIIQATHSIDRK